ncbi:HBR030Wp [Eremothecium sinecaudum]|uniref:DNA polymerase epsilon subunit D n=1 Tax=Eremothecium sinecaudum TaxID=45286 RepID=A0A120K133_9SACH|nr:HBR030Wp [Eremothecium sinecaudum]AMD18931.1 HBR030Wp [Eremothecium sinecaudum]
MPPKGWKKDAQGNYPTTSYIKEQEKVTVDDLLFPKSIITSIAKEALHSATPDSKVMLSKDASIALQRSSTVFVNHLLMYARENAKNNDSKSCNEDDILSALEQIGLTGFKPIIRNKVVEYERALRQRKGKSELDAESANVEDGPDESVNPDKDYEEPVSKKTKV